MTSLAPSDLADVHLDDEVPCEGADHPQLVKGHTLGPAAFSVVSPCCGFACLQCAGRVRYLRTFQVLKCGRCRAAHPSTEYQFIEL